MALLMCLRGTKELAENNKVSNYGLFNCLLAKMGKYYAAGQGLMHFLGLDFIFKGRKTCERISSKIVINNQTGVARSMVSANECYYRFSYFLTIGWR